MLFLQMNLERTSWIASLLRRTCSMNLARSLALSEAGSCARRAAARWRRSFVPGRLAVAEPGRLTAEPGRLDGRPAASGGAGTTCRPPLPMAGHGAAP